MLFTVSIKSKQNIFIITLKVVNKFALNLEYSISDQCLTRNQAMREAAMPPPLQVNL